MPTPKRKKTKKEQTFLPSDPSKQTNASNGSITHLDNEMFKIQIINDNKLSRSDRINIIMALITFLSVVIAAWSVYEMIEDRAMAYKPDILLNPVTMSFEWDQEGYDLWLGLDENDPSKEKEENNTDGMFHEKIGLQFLSYDFFISLPLNNIGIGSAKNVICTWDPGNTRRLVEYLVECDPSKKEFCSIYPESVIFQYGDDLLVQVDTETEMNLMYMLPATATDENYSIPVPPQYIILLNEIIKTGQFQNKKNKSFPYIFLTISCYDTRDKAVDKKYILLKSKKIYLEKKENGSGKATYQLIPTYEE